MLEANPERFLCEPQADFVVHHTTLWHFSRKKLNIFYFRVKARQKALKKIWKVCFSLHTYQIKPHNNIQASYHASFSLISAIDCCMVLLNGIYAELVYSNS